MNIKIKRAKENFNRLRSYVNGVLEERSIGFLPAKMSVLRDKNGKPLEIEMQIGKYLNVEEFIKDVYKSIEESGIAFKELHDELCGLVVTMIHSAKKEFREPTKILWFSYLDNIKLRVLEGLEKMSL